jgi:sulfur carrier protein ThiS
MKLKLTMLPQNKKQVRDIKAKVVGDLLRELKLEREVYVFKKNGAVVTEAEPLKSGDHVEVIKVVSGG